MWNLGFFIKNIQTTVHYNKALQLSLAIICQIFKKCVMLLSFCDKRDNFHKMLNVFKLTELYYVS